MPDDTYLRTVVRSAVEFQKLTFELGVSSVRNAIHFQQRLMGQGTSQPARDLTEKARRPAMPDAKLEQLIRERAYQIWLDEGKPEGREKEHWERAEAEIQSELSDTPRSDTV